jgi:hypothetical protein
LSGRGFQSTVDGAALAVLTVLMATADPRRHGRDRSGNDGGSHACAHDCLLRWLHDVASPA